MHNNDLLSKVNNQQNKRLEPRMCYSVAGVNNPKNNSKKVETATKRNNAKINSKNDDAIKIKQKNDQLMLNRIRIIDDRKSRKINHYAEPKTIYVPQIHNTSSQINNIKDHTSINQPIESDYYPRNRGGASVNDQALQILQSRYLEDGINNTKKKKNQYKARFCY